MSDPLEQGGWALAAASLGAVATKAFPLIRDWLRTRKLGTGKVSDTNADLLWEQMDDLYQRAIKALDRCERDSEDLRKRAEKADEEHHALREEVSLLRVEIASLKAART